MFVHIVELSKIELSSWWWYNYQSITNSAEPLDCLSVPYHGKLLTNMEANPKNMLCIKHIHQLCGKTSVLIALFVMIWRTWQNIPHAPHSRNDFNLYLFRYRKLLDPSINHHLEHFCIILWLNDQGAVSIRETVLPGMAIPMLKIRRPNGRLIFNMEIAIRR